MINRDTVISLNKNEKKLPNIFINSYILSIILIIAFSVAISLIGIMLGDKMSLQTVKWFFRFPTLILLNTIPLTLFMLFIYFITSRIWCSFVFGGGFFILLELVNKFKLELRDDPFMPSDMLLGGEVANVIKISELNISKKLVAMLILFALASIFFILFTKSKKVKILGRTSGALVCVLAFVLIFNIYYKNVTKYDKYPVRGYTYSTADVFRSRGFIYSFLVSFETFKVKMPDGYSQKEAEQLLSKYNIEKKSTTQKKPNVIAIMGEAFYNFDRIPGVKFIEGKNPLENYNKIKKEAYSGGMITSVFGGGTCTTELNFLTGYSTSLLPNGMVPYKSYIRSNQYSLARFFTESGYTTTAFHPGYPWFYNRQNVYKFFDFQNIFFQKDMEKSSYNTRRELVTDQDAMEFILDNFNKHINSNSNKPYFNFNVTIENHSPYNNITYDEKIFVKPAGMSDNVYNVINSYLYGLREADKALGYLVSELEKSSEPVVLVYFGDHLPLLNNNYEGYNALGFNIGQNKGMEAFLNNFRAPYFIWSNTAAQELLKSNGVQVLSGSAPEISACFLSAELMKYTGMTPSPYFEFLTQLEKSIPVITHKYFKQDGEYVTELSKGNQDLMSDYKKIQYYMMFDNKVK